MSERPYRTTIASRKPRNKAHLTYADMRRAVAVASPGETLLEDVQVWVWGVTDWELVHTLKKGTTPPWREES